MKSESRFASQPTAAQADDMLPSQAPLVVRNDLALKRRGKEGEEFVIDEDQDVPDFAGGSGGRLPIVDVDYDRVHPRLARLDAFRQEPKVDLLHLLDRRAYAKHGMTVPAAPLCQALAPSRLNDWPGLGPVRKKICESEAPVRLLVDDNCFARCIGFLPQNAGNTRAPDLIARFERKIGNAIGRVWGEAAS